MQKTTRAKRPVVAEAGRFGAVTVATNMAGRGTDIMLGGNAEFIAVTKLHQAGLNPTENPEEFEARWDEVFTAVKAEVSVEAEKVVAAGGLYVLGTERHESRRIDNQLRGRSGRQATRARAAFICRFRMTSCVCSTRALRRPS